MNGVRTTDEFAQSFLDDALAVLHFLGPAPFWSAKQDEADPYRWTINGVGFCLDYGATNEGSGSLLPAVPDRTCPECDESVGWRFHDDRRAQAEIECKGCGELLVVDRWWTKHSAPGGAA